MQKFEETESARQAIRDLTGAYELHKETNLTADEKAVKEQKTLFYKMWCGMIYGHLYRGGVCLRCQKENIQ